MALSLTDIARKVPIEIGDHDFCKKGYDGWHDINIENGSITKNSIKLCKGLDKEKLVSVAKHEIGHQVHEAYLTQEQRKQWEDLHKQSKSTVDHLRTYSSQSVLEDFADIYSASYSKTKPLRSNLFDKKLEMINSFKPTLKPQYNLFDFSNIKK